DALTDEYIDDYLEVTVSGTDKKESRITTPSYEEVVPPSPKARKKSAQLTAPEYEDSEETVESSSIDINPYGSYETGNSSSTKKEKEKDKSQNNSAQVKKENDVATVIQTTDSGETSSSGRKTYRNKSSNESSSQSSSDSSAKTENDDITGLTDDELLSKAQESYDEGQYEKTLEYLDAFFDKATEKIDQGLFIQAQTYESNSSVRNIKNALDTYETIVKDYPQSINWTKAYERMTYLKRFYFNIR
uniref:hypothetical protein n=1 Tax=Treponema sp. TaxID=166 RepID=UPI0025DB51E0